MNEVKRLLQKSCHYSGYERQAAVEALGHHAEKKVLYALLLRVNDWVPQVRASAKQSLRHLLQNPRSFKLFYDLLPTCFTIERSPRESHQMLLQEIVKYVGVQNVKSRLYISFFEDPSPLAQWSWISALKHKILPIDTLLDLGLNHPSSSLRHEALQHWQKQPPDYQKTLALVHLKSRFSALRETALRILFLQQQNIPHPHVLIWDASLSIRLHIIPHLNSQAVITAYHYELYHPLNNSRLKIALWGMGYLKHRQAKSQIELYAQQNKRLSLKRAACQTLLQGILSKEEQHILIASLFEHSALSMVRLALRWNQKLKIQHIASQWIEKWEKAPKTHFPFFIEAMRYGNKWEFLDFLLATKAPPELLLSWLDAFNRKAQQPSKAQKQTIEKHWPKPTPEELNPLICVLRQSGLVFD